MEGREERKATRVLCPSGIQREDNKCFLKVFEIKKLNGLVESNIATNLIS